MFAALGSRKLRFVLPVALSLLTPVQAFPADSEPRVTVKLVRDRLFVGEAPRIRIRVTAPRDRDVKTISPGMALEDHCRRLVKTPGGQIVNGSGPSILPIGPFPGALFSTLDAGSSREMELDVIYSTRSPGPHLIEVKLQITPEPSSLSRFEVVANANPILPADVVSKAVCVVPHNPHYNNVGTWGTVEFLNVKTGKGFELLSRRLDDHDRTVMTRRLCELDKDSAISAIAKPVEGMAYPNYLVVFNKRSNLILVKINHASGTILEESVIDPIRAFRK